MNLDKIIESFENKLTSEKFDLTLESDSNKTEYLSGLLYKNGKDSNELRKLEKKTSKILSKYSLFTHLAVKTALSKKILSEIRKNVHITVVFAVYKEHNRILTRKEHPNGENFLIRKIKQIEDLTGDFKNITWDMLVVDDGCSENSGKIAEEILKKEYFRNNVKVLYLQDAINEKLKVAEGLKTTDDSRKGGSILYGMWYASQQKRNGNHIICYTDADLSTHLGQLGLLAEPIIKENMYAAIGSRREDRSVVIKKEARNSRGKLFIYLWKRMIKRLNYITDTQCGFKAFRAEIIPDLVFNNIEKKFAFDIELLIKADILKRESIAKVPIAWIDSEAESTTTDLQPYTDMLKSIAQMYFKYLPANAVSHSFAYFVKSLNQEKWDILVSKVPEGILIKSAIHYDMYDEIKVSTFEKILEK